MKKVLGVAAMAAALFALTGCAGSMGSGGPNGIIFSDKTVPLSGDSVGSTKQGTAVCTGILSIVATGDCSVEAAAKNGGITQVQSVEAKIFDVLGLYTTYTTIVKGR